MMGVQALILLISQRGNLDAAAAEESEKAHESP